MNRKWFERVAAVCAALMMATVGLAEEFLGGEASDVPVIVTAAPEMEVQEEEIPLETAVPPQETQPEEGPGVSDAPLDVTSAPEDVIDVPLDATDLPPATETSDDVPSGETLIIVQLGASSPAEVALEVKPELEEVLAALPESLLATLSDGTQTDVSVSWICPDYAAETEEYVFSARLEEPGYELAEGVGMPGFILRIQPKQQVVSGDFTFSIDGQGGLTLVNWTGTGCQASVPAAVDGAPVVAVAKSAFAGNQWITDAALPASVIALEAGAFENCDSLRNVSLPDSLEFVGGGLFNGCDELDVLELKVSNETSTADNRGYTRRIVETDGAGNETVRDVRVELGREWTDVRVLDSGKWRIDGAVAVKSGHEAAIAGGGALYIAAGGSVTVNGALINGGAARNDGVIFACSGSVSGMDGEIIRDHRYSDGVCAVCGARQTLTLSVTPTVAAFERTYDGTCGLNLGPGDFVVEGVREGDEVAIAAVNTSFNESDAGNYLAAVSFQLGGADAAYYSALPMELSVIIHKKRVSVTPRAGQSKVYGAEDPFLRASYRGVVSGETLAGKLSREPGESVGKYRITIGTLADSNPNYQIVLGEAEFEIVPKSISDSTITVGRIPNQRYTGEPLTPVVEVRDGKRALVQGVDYQVNYQDNVDAGSAKVSLTGCGNYEGARTAGFRIIKVSGGTAGDSGDPEAFLSSESDTGVDIATGDALDFEIERQYSEGNLMLDGVDRGNILFDEMDQPRPFCWRERAEVDGDAVRQYLCIESETCRDEQGLPVEDDYGQPRLRMTMVQINALRQEGFTDVELVVGTARVRFPLDTLFAEYTYGGAMLAVDSYEVRLWPVDAEPAVPTEWELGAWPCHFEMLALPADVENPQSEDVLSLLAGVQLVFMPEAAEQVAGYALVHAEVDEQEILHEMEEVVPIAENGEVLATPERGGLYAIVRG